jgi:hypothetical protein
MTASVHDEKGGIGTVRKFIIVLVIVRRVIICLCVVKLKRVRCILEWSTIGGLTSEVVEYLELMHGEEFFFFATDRLAS